MSPPTSVSSAAAPALVVVAAVGPATISAMIFPQSGVHRGGFVPSAVRFPPLLCELPLRGAIEFRFVGGATGLRPVDTTRLLRLPSFFWSATINRKVDIDAKGCWVF